MTAYTLVFSWSRSPRYRRAVALATAVPGTVVTGAGREHTHRVPVGAEALPVLTEPLVAVVPLSLVEVELSLARELLSFV